MLSKSSLELLLSSVYDVQYLSSQHDSIGNVHYGAG